MTVIVITITGPVDIPSVVLLIIEPIIPLMPPNIAERISMLFRLDIHWRAAAAGAMSIATIRTTPTVFRPMTTATTITDVSKALRYLVGKPKLCPNALSNVAILNSLKNTIRTAKHPAAKIPRLITSVSIKGCCLSK